MDGLNEDTEGKGEAILDFRAQVKLRVGRKVSGEPHCGQTHEGEDKRSERPHAVSLTRTVAIGCHHARCARPASPPTCTRWWGFGQGI